MTRRIRRRLSLGLFLGSIASVQFTISNASASLSATSAPAPSPDSIASKSNDADSPPVDRERQLLERGYLLRQQGRDADALVVYREAYALRHDTKPLAQVALALEAIGHWSQAYRILQQALADRSHPWINDNRTLLENELARIEQQLGHVTFEIQPAGAAVRVNGTTLGTAPLGQPLLLNPGSSTVEVDLPGYAPYRHELEIQAGKQYHEVIRLTRRTSTLTSTENPYGSGSASLTPRHDASPAWPSRRNPLWLGTAAGGVFVASMALVPWSIANDKVDRLAQDCKADPNCSFPDRSHDIRQLDHVTNVLLFSGLGITATSIVLYLTVPQAAPESGLGVTTWVNRDGAGLSYRGVYR